METTEIRRPPDGSIDIEFYRARAAALRSQAVREAFGWRAASKFVGLALTGLYHARPTSLAERLLGGASGLIAAGGIIVIISALLITASASPERGSCAARDTSEQRSILPTTQDAAILERAPTAANSRCIYKPSGEGADGANINSN